MGTGFGFGLSITLLLTLLIKFLFVVFIIGLVGGLIIAAKNFIFTPEDIEAFKAPFRGDKVRSARATCSVCGKEVSEGWKVCPYCSNSLEE